MRSTERASPRWWKESTPADEGRPSYPPLMMVKVLLLGQWYNLSDPQMEEALGDRISFRRFVGLGLQDDTPDYSTISRFRTELSKAWSGRGSVQGAGVSTGQAWSDLEGRDVDGRHTGGGQVRRPSVTEGRGAKSSTDPDAHWSYSGRGSRAHFGHKVHLDVDDGTGLVRRAKLTPGKVYESEVADGLAAENDRIHVLHREGKQGLGSAYIAGFRWALEREYDWIFEMDADGSHDPKYLLDMLEAMSIMCRRFCATPSRD